MRIRSLKPEFWSHPVMARLPAETRLMAIALISWSDDHGYFEADARAIRGAVMPYRDSLKTIDRDLQRLVEVGFIEIRLTEAHGRVGRLPKWKDHQKVDHPKGSSLLEHFNSPGSRDAFASASRIAREASGEEGKGREGKGRDLGKERKGEEGREPAQKAARKKPAQANLIEAPSPSPKPPAPPTRIGKLHGFFLEERGYRLTDDPPDGLGFPEAAPDEDPNWGMSAAALSAWCALFPEYSEEDQDRFIKAMIRLWLLETYWASPPPKPGKASIPYPWGAFITEKQWRKAYEKLSADEPKAGAA